MKYFLLLGFGLLLLSGKQYYSHCILSTLQFGERLSGKLRLFPQLKRNVDRDMVKIGLFNDAVTTAARRRSVSAEFDALGSRLRGVITQNFPPRTAGAVVFTEINLFVHKNVTPPYSFEPCVVSPMIVLFNESRRAFQDGARRRRRAWAPWRS